MLEILSFVFGGLFRLAPEVLKMFNAKSERTHEKEMLELNLKADEARAKLDMQKMEMQGNISMNVAELQALIEGVKAQAQPLTLTGNKYVDAMLGFVEVLNRSVRPVLTYWFCVAMYGAYKVTTIWLVLKSGASWLSAVNAMWTDKDQSVMWSIIGFWFVDRSLRAQNK
ncbi:hypothetical protein UFOVP1326_7 [uncultured Caudovirales phage]|uniref:Holin of 3TMs, for gene-transfer release n=1 Tax=uncultured Caudovirales phage TaxID=2100421 RepID=A0A6J5RXB2_9CAUD|nr:hypothetical protein UFOVP1326_7 [uncultured Caudovirales phage]CAB4212760.1 hypothetical protein UFOVP1436_32 [uncultured Caudovirales phage]